MVKPLDATRNCLEIKILAWNIHGLSDKLGYPEICSKLRKYDVILLSETWLSDMSSEKEYKLSGYEPKSIPRAGGKSSGGLILYVKNNVKKYVSFVKNVCDHFMIIRVDGVPQPRYIIFSYILPYDTTYKCSSCDNNFYEQLYDLYITYSTLGTVYVCGDLNSRTADLSDCPENYDTTILDKFGIEDCLGNTLDADNCLSQRISCDTICNTQGKLLLDFCKSTGMRIVNGRFPSKSSGNFTYYRLMKKGTDKIAKSSIDYLLVPCTRIHEITNFEVDEKIPESDHCSISYTFTVQICQSNTGTKDELADLQTYSKFKWDDLKSERFVECLFDEEGRKYLDHFADCIRELKPCDVVSDAFGLFIEQAANRCLTKIKCKKKKSRMPVNDWYDDECKLLKRQLHNARKKKIGKAAILGLELEYNRVIQRKRRNSKLKKAADIMHVKGSTAMWEKLKILGSPSGSETQLGLKDFHEHFSKPAVENPDNVHNFDLPFENEIVQFMKNYKSKTNDYNSVNGNSDENLITDLLNSVITEEEVRFALRNLKKGKSPGLDGLPIDIFIKCENQLLKMILHLLNYILDNGTYPEKWAQGLIDPLFKKGSTELPSNYRRISILPAISKIIEFILNNRLQYVDRIFLKEDPYNGGFKKDSRTTDNIFILSSLVECSKLQRKPLYVCFVDFKRAFDCIKRDFMFYKLLLKGYDSKVLNLIIDMYAKTKSFVKWNGKLSDCFADELGVAQGGILSPYLFNSFLSDLGENLNKKHGIVLDAETILTHLFWADDLILMSDSADGLQAQIDNLYDYCSKWQMIINNMKTKCLVFNEVKSKSIQEFHVGDVKIEVATQYTYLGVPFSTEKQSEVIKDYILNNCRRALYKIRSYCLPLGQVPPKLGLQLFDSLIMPLMDYASELWANKTITDGLETFQLGYLKRILGVRPQTPTLAVYGELGRQPIVYRLEMNRLKYLHRLSNLPDHTIAKKMFDKLSHMHTLGFSTWVTKSLNLYEHFEETYDISLDDFCTKSRSWVKSKLKKYERKRYSTSWTEDMKAITSDKKLRTYVLFKSNLERERYLSLPVPKYRFAIARFRCSSHNLPIELGRHTKPKKTDLNDRLCKTCNVLGDELHHVVSCKANQELRNDLYDAIKKYKPDFVNLSDIEKFKFIMKTKVTKLIYAFGYFIHKSQLDL